VPQLRILVTAGPTVEDIDPVRFISNRSSGKLGVAVAAAMLKAGHRAVLVHGPVGETVLNAVRRLGRKRTATVMSVRSAAEMHRAVVTQSRRADAIIMTAAVADFTPAVLSSSKLKKAKSGVVLRLKPTADILGDLGRRKGRRDKPILIGFALETGTGRTPSQRAQSQLAEAQRKLREKNLDAIVLDSPKTMGADDGDFRILFRDNPGLDCSGMTKPQLAKLLVEVVDTIRRKTGR
jgi:phosphopantothenoylcysteine decarboxylase/phosphopantothenate--cysteine ligase